MLLIVGETKAPGGNPHIQLGSAYNMKRPVVAGQQTFDLLGANHCSTIYTENSHYNLRPAEALKKVICKLINSLIILILHPRLKETF